VVVSLWPQKKGSDRGICIGMAPNPCLSGLPNRNGHELPCAILAPNLRLDRRLPPDLKQIPTTRRGSSCRAIRRSAIDPNGLFTPDELTRVQDGVDAMVEACGVWVTERTDSMRANVSADGGSTSAAGSRFDPEVECPRGPGRSVCRGRR
jgi:hypothetical protein